MDDLLSFVRNIFPTCKVLLLYYSGSRGYGFNDDTSDIDITAVLDGFKGNMHVQLGEIDIFAFSKEDYIKRQFFDETIIDYYKSAADDILVCKDKVIYLDNDFEQDYQNLKQFDHKKFLINQLDALLNYTKMRFGIKKNFKSHYHIFRMRGMVDHYDKTDKYELVVEAPWFTKMMDFKHNWENEKSKPYIKEIKEQVDYLENYRNELIKCGLG
ncbi:hypothetical protein HF295_04515 [Hujiaoplasma nucleasis]|uniref:Nucleotidyltransferase domain-containing protein n=1 Tax=Hujiaoplasma nucleasis TaxID=2725268 RepID=A0A7L6N1W4_9MOLU|nr:hypothetical protein [Hujiaoplasma nucleasis]QLY40163.1 hypothetical protein HF295_04515 [Hujiaoplasma nucleasis]